MRWLLDTNILVRLADSTDADYATANRAVHEIHRRGESMHLTPQVLIEFRNVSTRPAAVNGMGLSIADAESKAAAFESAFPLLADTPDIFPAWKSLVQSLGVVGKQVHDARLVAVCHAHGVGRLLTFNGAHFARMASSGPGITAIHPASI